MRVTGRDLQRDGHRRQRQADAQQARRRALAHTARQLPRRKPGQQKGASQGRRQQHVREAVGERRVEDHVHPALDVVHAGHDLVAGGGRHPRVQRQDPERRQRGAEGNEEGRQEVHPLAHSAVTEQHHAQEAGFEEKRGQHLVAERRTGDVAHGFHEARPVGAELETHRDAADDAERECQREHLGPEAIGVKPALRVRAIGVGARGQPAPAEEQQHPAQPDADDRREDVKADVGRKLRAGQTWASMRPVPHAGVDRRRWHYFRGTFDVCSPSDMPISTPLTSVA